MKRERKTNKKVSRKRACFSTWHLHGEHNLILETEKGTTIYLTVIEDYVPRIITFKNSIIKLPLIP